MSFKNAWLGLIGELPKIVEVEKIVEKPVTVEVVKEAIGQASAIQLYGFNRKTGKQAVNLHSKSTYEKWLADPIMRSSAAAYANYMEDEWETVYSFSCEQAHLEAKGSLVASVPCIKVGSQYFKIAEAVPVKTLSKPKVSKGKQP
jgi:hypothetical protein